jgi:signal transduction histidine kinase
MREVVELSRDLERMKNQLIGINDQLKLQISELEASERKRRSLERQLHHSQRLETIGVMAGGFAHALNNMLVPIILYAELTHESLSADSPARADLDRVLSAARRAKHIVSQILTFSHRTGSVEFAPVDLGQIVREAVELVRASMPASADISLAIEPDCPKVLADAGQLSQLIFNMCNNALQSLDEGAGRIDISLDSVAPEDPIRTVHPILGGKPCVRLRIRDNGHGMEHETIKHIFEPFFTTRSVGKGTGLGLSVVHGIVTDLDGIIDVSSEVGVGTTFSIYLPAIERSISEN